jgi:putative intracellular protease/amidase
VELAQVLREFENDYEFTFATPDGKAPKLDINGMGLAFNSIEKLGPMTLRTTIEQRRRSFDIDRYRRRHADLVQRHEQELQLLERHLGRLLVSDVLPNTDREAAAFRPGLVRRLEALPTKAFHSVEALVRRHRDQQDAFSFADFDFVHAPGGHAPMVSFRDNRWLGEALHLAREHGVLISLICHASVA